MMRPARLFTALLTLLACVQAAAVEAQTPGRFLGKEEILVYGLGLQVEPAVQTVPKGFATIVSVFLRGGTDPGALPPFAPDAEVRATLRGPSFAAPIDLVTRPNTPFQIPILTVAGTHTLEGIRLVSGGEVVLYGSPEVARIDVIDKLLVTTVTARPLTADEIREKGIVFDRENFQAYNFTAAFAIDDGSKIAIGFPVVLPAIAAPKNVNPSVVSLEGIDVPLLRSIQTIIPDTLQIQARIPNLSVVGFSLTLDQGASSQNFYVPPIPGVIVIPGDIGFLNQFFSVMLMVANVAPAGSNLVVSELTANIVLPPGQDHVVGSNDDPLAMARRATGDTPRLVPVTQPGADGVLGTGDDVTSLGPGQTGNAEFLVEGRREGTHIVEMELAGILNGLPVGPVPIRGRAAGAVLVRNPTFTLTFTHPDVVNVGEPYTLDVTVTNSSQSPANIVSLNLFGNNISGARLDDEPSKSIDFIAPGDSASVTFRLISERTGKVTAATLDSGENVAGRFQLKTAIGELGVPLSPDSLVLPKEASSLPAELRNAALGLLGRAWAVATAPPAALPKDLSRFSKQVVLDRAVETAEAGLRLSLGESLTRVSTALLLDHLGSEYTELPSRVPAGDTTGLLDLLQRDVKGFDLVRRLSVRGDVLADAIGQVLAPAFSGGPLAFHLAVAEQLTSRPGHISYVLSAGGAPLPVDAYLIDSSGRQSGGLEGSKVRKEIPFSDVVTIRNSSGEVTGLAFFVAVPEVGDYTLTLGRRPGTAPDAAYDASVAYPAGDGRLRFASFAGLGPAELPVVQQDAADATRVRFALAAAPSTPRTAAPAVVNDPAPSVLGVVQMAAADMDGCKTDPPRVYPIGRVVAVLFSEEVTPESVGDKLGPNAIVAFRPENNRAMGVALQPGGRIAYVALREPVGPLVPRTMTVEGVADRSGQVMPAAQTSPIVATVPDQGGQVSGRVVNADGTPSAHATVRLFYEFSCGEFDEVVGVAEEITDADGRFHFDYVLAVGGMTVKLAALDAGAEQLRIVRFRLARARQHLNVDVVLLGRGSIRGRTLSEQGVPLANTTLRFTSATDQSQYSTLTNALGEYQVGGVPVGNVLIEAVNVDAAAQTFVSEHIPFAGAVVTRDITLLDVDTTGVVIKYGGVSGRVVRADGVTPVANVPVIAWYQSGSQPGVDCPRPPQTSTRPTQCAVAVVNTNNAGEYVFPSVTAGELRLVTFDQADLMEGTVRVSLPADGSLDVTILIAGGFGTVRGVVLDASGAPVTDAVVGGGLSLAHVNPADGTFELTDVPVGRRKIVAVSDSLQSSGEMTVDIVQQGETVNATIVLQPVGAVAGIVRSKDGVPQAGIKVWVFRECYDEDQQPSVCILGEATTGAAGDYRIDKLQVGQYTVSAFRADMTDGNLNQFAIRYNRQVLINDITFRGGFGTVQGRVLRACAAQPCGDTPLPAKVGISGDRLVVAGGKVGVKFEYVQNFAVTDNDFTTGAYAFSNVWVGPFTVRAAGQFSPEPIAVEGAIPAAGQAVTVDIRLQPTSRITGTVYEPDGFTPVTSRQISLKFKSNAVIVICTEDSATGDTDCQTIPQGIQEAFATTDSEGRFLFPIVNAGPFTITATDDPPGGPARTGEVRGTVRAGDDVDVSVRLLGRAAVTVKVFRSDGTTIVPNATVELKQIDEPRAERTGVALNGTVTFGGGDSLTEGQFVVKATDQNGFTGRASGRVLIDGQDVTVNVFLFDATGTVSGQVMREDASGALVTVPNAEVVLSTQQGPIAFTLSDAAGDFTIPLVPTTNVTIEAFDPVTAARGRASGVVLGGAVATALSVRLEPLGSIRGTLVQNGTFTPLKGWSVRLRQTTPSGRQLPEQMAQTGVDGGFSFPGASVGTFRLDASLRSVVGGASATGQLSEGGQLVDVPMVATIQRRVSGGVTGLVTTANGTPVPNAQVEVCAHPDACRPTTGGGDGRFSLDDVPLGRFTVRATAQVTGNPSVGKTGGTILFEGDSADVTITLLGLSVIEGTVYQIVNGQRVIAPNAAVKLAGNPGSGCPGACQQSSDANGQFRFTNVPALSFTVSASGLGGQQGSAGGVLVPGQTLTGLEVDLAASTAFSGRAVLAGGAPAAGVVAELAITASGRTTRLYAESNAAGTFTLDAVGAGTYVLSLQDPVAGGIARRTGTISLAGPIDVGDLTLDEAPPVVAGSTPAAGALGVPQTVEIRVTFSERINAGSLTPATFTVQGPDGPVAGLVDLLDNDTVGRFRLLPGAQLEDQTRYTVRIKDAVDLAGRRMASDFTMAFTTLDLTPPVIVETTPGAGASGVTIDTTIRVKYSEIIDPAGFAGPAITVTGPGGPVAGRIDFAFSNTVAIFTPNRPLDEDAQYSALIRRATDLAGQQQAADLTVAFTTTDRTPPVVVSLTPSNNGVVIEGAVAHVTAVVTPSDVAVVDFFINDIFAFADRAAPFVLSLDAAAAFGGPGSRIKISAVATDTSGNRGPVPVSTFLDVIADTPPVVAITQPAAGITAPGGQRIDVTVQASDDLGISQIAYIVRGAGVIDAATRPVSPASGSRQETFAFNVPAGAVPGSLITIEASARDTRGQTVAATPVAVRVLDSVGPVVDLTGVSSGQRVQAGQQVTAVVVAQDPGLVAQVGLDISGVLVRTEQRPVDPARASVATSFVFTVPAGAASGDSLTLRPFAIDAAGNRGNGAQTTLPVADKVAPTVVVRTLSGGLEVPAGRPAEILVDGSDDLALATLRLTATGANGFTFDETKSVPPVGSTSATFIVQVPDTMQAGDQIVLTGRAVDASGNPSAPVSLTVTVRTVDTVTLPPSVFIEAGADETIVVTLGNPAPAGGTRVDLASRNNGVAGVTGFVQIAAGETSASATVRGISGGTTQVDASIGGVLRQTMTVTVAGGIVRGTVMSMVNGALTPAASVQVTVFHGGTPLPATTSPDGRFQVAGVAGTGNPARQFSVSATDGSLLGFVESSLDVPGGSADVTVILIEAGAIQGTVQFADTTPVGAGIRVELFESASPSVVIATTFTDASGGYQFPLVAAGPYRLDASDAAGNRGRANAVIDSGATASIPVIFLGRGQVTGVVRSGAGAAVPNASVELHSSSLFGNAPKVTQTADAQGRFSFPGVFVGSVTVQAADPLTSQAGSVAGQLTAHGQALDLVVALAPYGNLRGTVRRADNVTVAPGASVTVRVNNGPQFNTTADAAGGYAFDFLPLGTFTVTVFDGATRGRGLASGLMTVSGQAVQADVLLMAQGTLLVTVVDANGVPVNGASVTAQTTQLSLTDSLSGATSTLGGIEGRVLFDRLMIGAYSITASAGGLGASATGQLADGEFEAVTVSLEPQATIEGLVLDQDGQTPAAGRVRVFRSGAGQVATLPLVNGRYTFTGRLGTYQLVADDAANRARTVAATVTLTANGERVTQGFTFVALGTVSGQVIPAVSGGDVGKLPVVVQSLNPDFGRSFSTATDAAGHYSVSGVPIGAVTVTTSKSAEQLIGEANGSLVYTPPLAPELFLNVQLRSNAVALSYSLVDANNTTYTVAEGGNFVGGSASTFAFGGGGPVLRLTPQGGSPVQFSGASFGTLESSNREVAIQQSLAGLNVTRKIFVPTAGYFARYLEVLSNPGTQPVILDVSLSSSLFSGVNQFCSGGFNFCRAVHFISSTSSGDAVIDVASTDPDRWVSLRHGTGFQASNNGMSLGFVFDGEGAPLRVSSAAYSSTGPDSPANGGNPQFTLAWTNITVQPGETVTLMHFVSLQENVAGATASAQRLVLLPPEALDGLSPEEITSVRNFAVPATGISAVQPLPPLTGAVSGRVLEGDGLTVVPGAGVEFQSSLGMYPRRLLFTANASGSFSFTGAIGAPVPLAPFTVRGTYPGHQNHSSPATDGSFDPGSTAAIADAIFSDAGIMTGVVRRQNGTPVVGAFIEIPFLASMTTDASGRYRFGGVTAGNRVLRGQLNRTQGDGTALAIVQQAFDLTAGQVRDDVLFLEPSGGVTGTLRDAAGNLQSGKAVTLKTADNQFQRTSQSDTSGRYTFTDVRVGTLVLTSVDSTNGLPATANVTIVADATATVDLTYTGNLPMEVLVTRASGTPLSGMTVQIAGTGFSTLTATTGVDGRALIANVPAGRAATVTVFHPSSSTLLRATRNITTGAATAQQTLSLPAFGTVTGEVRRPNGTLAGSGIRHELTRTNVLLSTTTDAASRFTLGPVPAGLPFNLATDHPSINIDGSRARLTLANLLLTADGQTLTVNTFYPAVAQLTVTVRENGVPVANATVQEAQVNSSGSIFYTSRGTTNASGVLVIATVGEGVRNYRVLRPGSSTVVLETASVVIDKAHDGGSVSLLIDAKVFNVTVRGMIYEADGLTPLTTSGQVELRRGGDGALLATTFISAANPGLFQFTQFDATTGTQNSGTGKSTGAGLIVRARSPFQPFDSSYTEHGLVPTSDGQLQLSITMPVRRATVRGRVLAADGVTPISAGAVWLDSLTDGTPALGGGGSSVGADGTWTHNTTYYPVEGVRAKLGSVVGVPSGTVQAASGPITVRDEVVTLDLLVPADVYFNTVTGTVTAGDGVTPLDNVSVQLTSDVASCCSTATASDGTFRFGVAFPLDAAFTVTARWQGTNPPSITRQFTAGAAGATIDAGTFSLPLSVLRGTVTFGGVRPVEYPDVFVRDANNVVTWANNTEIDGTYRFIGLAPGTYTLVVEALGTGLTTSRTVVIASHASTVTEDVELPMVGRIEVRVIDRFGNQVYLDEPGRHVVLLGTGGPFEQYCSIDDSLTPNGYSCLFDGVVPGPYVAQASIEVCDAGGDCYQALGTASGTFTDTAQTMVLTISLAQHGELRVQTDPEWVAGWLGVPSGADMRMIVRATGADGPLGTVERVHYFSASDFAEEFAFPDIPTRGSIAVTVEWYRDTWSVWEGIVRVDTSLNPQQIQFVDLQYEHESSIPVTSGVAGDDGWYYFVDEGGQLSGGSKFNAGGQQIYHGAFSALNRLQVNGVVAAGQTVLSRFDNYVQQGGNWVREWTELTIGPYSNDSPVSALRKIYQPLAGGFVRYLDTFTNPTNVPVTIEVTLASQVNGGSLSTSGTSGPVFARVNNAATGRASFGMVFSDFNTSARPALVLQGGGPAVTQFITIPPNSQRSVLSFVVLRDPTDAAGLTAQVNALMSPLSVPAALKGLTFTDLSRIVNFVLVPGQ